MPSVRTMMAVSLVPVTEGTREMETAVLMLTSVLTEATGDVNTLVATKQEPTSAAATVDTPLMPTAKSAMK